MDGSNLVDELEKLQDLKKEIDSKIGKIKEDIISLANKEDTDSLIGTNVICSIKEYEKVAYPDDKAEMIKRIKEKGLYDEYSMICYQRLSPAILKGKVDSEIIEMVKKEKIHRLFLKKL